MSIRPSGRIYIQVRETREVIDIDRFLSINTSLHIDSTSTAGIRLANKADRWYTFRSRDIKQQTDLSQFLLSIYNKPVMRDMNRKVRALLDEAKSESNADKRRQKLLEVYSMEERMVFDLFCRVWIDFRGRSDLIDLEKPDNYAFSKMEERWYAGFTGLITGLSEDMQYGKNHTVGISCSDMRRLFEVTKVAVDPGYKPIIKTKEDMYQSLNAMANTWSSFVDGANIIKSLNIFVDKTFHEDNGDGTFLGTNFWVNPSTVGKLENQQYDYNEAFKEIVERNYTGYSHRRPLKGFADSYHTSKLFTVQEQGEIDRMGLSRPKSRKNDIIKYIGVESVLNDATKINEDSDESFDSYQISRYGVDKMILAGDGSIATNPYQQLIKSTFAMQTTRVDANEILRKVAGIMGYQIWFDTKGNIIYQKVRYDDFPGKSGDYDNSVQSRGLVYKDEIDDYFNEQNGSISEKDKFGMKYHGRNYIIGDESLMGWSFSKDEDSLVTHLIVPTALQLIPQLNEILGQYYTGVGFASPDIMRTFGTRIMQCPPILAKGFNRSLVQTLADGLIRKVNSNLESCKLDLNTRPDLQLCRTIYVAERRKLYYITEIDQNLVWGRDRMKTSISGIYGHHPLDPIKDPWRKAFYNLENIPEYVLAMTEVDRQIKEAEYAATLKGGVAR